MPLPAKDMPPTRVKLLRPSERIASRKAAKLYIYNCM